MAKVVETSVAAVKMSGSFAAHDFSSSEDEEETTLRRPRSNAVSDSHATDTRKDTGAKTNSLCSKDLDTLSLSKKTSLSQDCHLNSLHTNHVNSVSTTEKSETGSRTQRVDTEESGPSQSLTHVSDNQSHGKNDPGVDILTDNSVRDNDADGVNEMNSSRSTSANQMSSPEILSSTSSPVMVNRTDAQVISTQNVLSCASENSSGSSLSREMYQQSRFNPFDRDIHMEEDHFSDNPENYFSCRDSSPKSAVSSHSSEHWNEGAFMSVENETVTFAELGLAEDHFSHPQGHFGMSQEEELKMAIDNCKDLIRKAVPDSERQKNLVRTLVQLRLKLQELKDEPEINEKDVVVVLGHRFQRKEGRSSKYYCEKCSSLIWGVVQEWRRCKDCGLRCHDKCALQITRNCAMVKVKENPRFIMEVCPRNPRGLAGQDYRCAECKALIQVADGVEPRVCQYNGLYYCELCHWNDLMYIPAQILLNWDFEKRKVCRASKQFLKLMMKKAVISVQQINPMLFNYVEQLNDIKSLREELLMMKKYILACPTAMQAKLLLQLSSRPHFVECSDRYSLQDLLDSDDTLIPDLVQVHSSWAQHIKTDCELCQARGFLCELCTNKEVLFPFDNIAVICTSCSAVMHRICFAQKVMCPKCERRRKRQQEENLDKT